MRYEIIEKSVVPKTRAGDGCEDALFINPQYVAVIDGATSKTGRKSEEGLTDGAVVAWAITTCLDGLEAGMTGAALVHALTTKVRDAMSEVEHNAGAALAVLSVAAQTVTRVGDVTVRINGSGDVPVKKIDTVVAAARAAYTSALLLRHEKTIAELAVSDPGRKMVFPLLAAQYVFQNDLRSPYGYGSIDGNIVPDPFIEEFGVAPGDVVALASDGYPALGETLAETEAMLAADLANDRLRLGDHASTKGFNPTSQISFDDRSYLRLRLL